MATLYVIVRHSAKCKIFAFDRDRNNNAYYYYGDQYNGGNLFVMGLSNALAKGFYLIRKTGYENNLFSKHDDLF